MEQARTSLTVRAERQGLVEITDKIAAWLAEQKVGDGLLTVFIRHTSASLLIQENVDSDVQRDLEN
jgi:secondary thiamine-phosphate synthase enzyme